MERLLPVLVAGRVLLLLLLLLLASTDTELGHRYAAELLQRGRLRDLLEREHHGLHRCLAVRRCRLVRRKSCGRHRECGTTERRGRGVPAQRRPLQLLRLFLLAHAERGRA